MTITEIYQTLSGIKVEDLICKLLKRSIATYRITSFNSQNLKIGNINTFKRGKIIKKKTSLNKTSEQSESHLKEISGLVEHGFATSYSISGHDLIIDENTLIVGELFQGVEARVKFRRNGTCFSISVEAMTISL